jgi:hypothetical protein
MIQNKSTKKNKTYNTTKVKGLDKPYLVGEQEFTTGVPSEIPPEIFPTEVKEGMVQQASDLSRQIFGKRIKVDLDSFILGIAAGSHGLVNEWKNEPKIRGKQGGLRPKKNQPILMAVTKYLQDHPMLAKASAEQIVNSLRKKTNSNKTIDVEFDGCDWSVYADNEGPGYIKAKNNSKGKKNIEIIEIKRSISTIRNYYIPEAKKIIKIELQEKIK